VKVKSYYAQSIEAAMASAGQEMGPDAVLITSRRTSAEARELGEYEVVFGLMNDSDSAQPQPRPSQGEHQVRQNVTEMEDVRRELEAMRRTLASAWKYSSNDHSMPELSHADALLGEADVAPDLKEELLAALELRLRQEALYNQAKTASTRDKRRGRVHSIEAASSGMDKTVSFLREQLQLMLETAPVLGTKDSIRSIVAIVGPTGSGKTTTIAKLAVQYGLTARRPALIISVDGYRVGATEQLRIYAAAIGVAFQAVDSAAGLRQVLEEHRNKGLVLIDTPGFGPADMDMAGELAEFLSGHPDIDVHLALPATHRASTLAKVVDQFAVFAPNKVILTKLDETESNGAALSHAILASLPLSFVTTGQQVPEDLAPADGERLLGFLGDSGSRSAVSAA
jgi:flagellar biosynthesis protein FlhF